MKRLIACVWSALLVLTTLGQTTLLADFEDETAGRLKINKDYTGSLFTVKPRIMENPSRGGQNTSSWCVGAVNVANADWWKNFLILDLKEPVTIDDSNRVLTLLAYRSVQPKDMRIAINTHEESGLVWQGKLTTDGQWERLSMDLGEQFYGRQLKSLYIILSCNWSDPRSGWGEATYCFDDITLGAGEALPHAQVTIRPAETYQTLRDFGASDCWTAEYVSDYFTADREKAARWLFSQEVDGQGNPEGIGLSCWRVNLGAGSAEQGSNSNIEDETRRGECYLKQDGTYDWSRCNGQQWFMQQAKAYGVDHFLLFSNSAPVYYTKNGLANAGGKNISCNLKDDCYDDFAEFLATTTKHFVDEGYNVTLVDPVNEPRFDWKDGQEGSPWENSNIGRLVRALDQSIQRRGLSTQILIPEASSWDLVYGGSGRASRQIASFFGSGSSDYVGNLPTVAPLVAGHSYWTFTTNSDLEGVRQQVRDEAAKYGVQAIQTEWSMLDAAPATSAGFPASYDAASKMDIALYMAKLICCDLTFGNMVGWHYWTAFAQERWSQKNRFYLIRMNAAGDSGDESYADVKQGGRLTADKNLWVLGQYSRFIRPGYQRVALDGAAEMNGLLGSAWRKPDGTELVCVLVNMSRSVRRLNLSAEGQYVTTVKAYVTDKDRNLRLMPVDDLSALEVPARSVTTLVLKTGSADGIEHLAKSVKKDGRWYTIGGCPLAGKPTRSGIYMYNGKKIFAPSMMTYMEK